MSRCAKDKIDQNREKCCIESITRGDVHQQSKGETCKDRDPGRAIRMLQLKPEVPLHLHQHAVSHHTFPRCTLQDSHEACVDAGDNVTQDPLPEAVGWQP